MATTQIFALIFIDAALLYWTDYRSGLTARRIEGTHNQCTDHANHIHELEASPQDIEADHQRLALYYKKLKDRNALRRGHHQSLVDIADKARIATMTYGTFRTDQTPELGTSNFRNKALITTALTNFTTKEDVA